MSPDKTRTRGISILALCLALIAGAPAATAAIDARIDRDTIAVGEALQLRLRLPDPGVEPDLTPLDEAFHVLGVQQSQRIEIRNGQRDESFEWWIEIMPRTHRPGPLEVPALRVGDDWSAPIALEVASAASRAPADQLASAASRAPTEPVVAVEASVDETRPYVQGQVQLTLRVVADGPILEGALDTPDLPGAIVEKTGEDTTSVEERDGRVVRVVERRYTIHPQESGVLEIPPLHFEGLVQSYERAPRRDPFEGLFGSSAFEEFFAARGRAGSLLSGMLGPRSRSVRAHSTPISLEVQPAPDEAADHESWLPARELSLVEDWKTDPTALRVGEPAVRFVGVRAVGLSGAQLPELRLPEVTGLKQYVEPSVEETVRAGGQSVAVRVQKTDLIPSRAGEIVLPAIELQWWDTEADQARIAQLPARTLTVLPADPNLAAATPAASPSPDTPATRESQPSEAPVGTAGWKARSRWMLIAAGATALGLIWLAGRRRPSPDDPPAERRAVGATAPNHRSRRDRSKAKAQAAAALRKACAANDPAAAEAAIRTLGAERWSADPPRDAREWGRRLGSPAFADALRELQRVRYSPDAGSWDGTTLWQEYRACRAAGGGPSGRTARSADALPALYPSP